MMDSIRETYSVAMDGISARTIMKRTLSVLLAFCATAGLTWQSKADPAQPGWNRLVDRAVTYLRGTQGDSGAWSNARSPGITGVVLCGLLHGGKVAPGDPMAVKALHYIESLVNPRAGHIAGKDPKLQLQNYVTCVNVMALVAANRADRYGKVIGDAARFLRQLQWDESENKQLSDPFYGGAGYDSHSRPDLSNTQFFVDALVDAGIPKDDPALQKALIFISRCQNRKGSNDQPWADKINDGSFIYTPAMGGDSKAGGDAAHGFKGYGSMTYAGLKSMIYCGLTKDDPRVKDAYEWIRLHYTVDANPGMPAGQGDRGLYYYYHTMAKCLDALGVQEVVDAKGERHDWRADLLAALAKRQRTNGSWQNDKDQFMEGDPNLVTGYVLMTLGYCRPAR
jgi:squalene-hopene/tetraprenyl-beta-curcumene cyclase